MNIESVIIHQIQKETDATNQAKLILSDELFNKSNQVITDLLQSLEQSFSKKTISRAKFSDNGFRETVLDVSKIDMIKDTQQLTKILKNKIDSIPKAKGGYLLFAKYKTKHEFLAVFFIKGNQWFKINQKQ